ncbi:4Fe-4S dicluster domain-containing protein [Proteiniborus ethanoligenes]|uniref:4Fe-4S dicluster domain-containing protein n=1 Tax=Proteiniborus ethanoligenes TaxID=415015 RepID=A0A1H3KZ10_9FIRM|nr:4Fe-4S binding protein [Proteiniborus ethanoligenes]TAH59877.1 MAG: 4Fe-4S ferredoxin [Gottschalkiaceae bacterium]SDY56884.1 4Fe-4S dicluster domain-containing protein [Proteiniborus ethanoligenes]
MAIRKIMHIDEEKCIGCGLCTKGCAESAIKIINGKAKLISENLCDGLGNCIGHCPVGAIQIIEREADEFDEEAAAKHLESLDKNQTSQAHGHGGGCPGSRAMAISRNEKPKASTAVSIGDIEIKIKPQLSQWPVQLMLVPERATYFDGKELLVTADCVPFAYPNYHLDLLKDKSVVIGCPKLDDVNYYVEKLTNIILNNDITGVTVAHMEVPCCNGIVMAVNEAVRRSRKNIEINRVKILIDGERER